MSQDSSWQSIVAEKRRQRDAKIPASWRIPPNTSNARPIEAIKNTGVLSQEELSLTDVRTDATALLKRLSSGQVTSEKLVTAFCKRAAVAQQLTNCLSEIMFEDAIARAKQLDAHLSSARIPIGPLHGLPITIKDCFHVPGYDSSIGLVKHCFRPARTTSQLARILLSLGAIVIAKTTVPQTMLCADTDSVVFGRTVNAYNSQYGAAGSSGGEAVVMALGGSALGVGTDGAGSVRMPAAVNGVVGYKPSGYRLPLDGRGVLGRGILGTTDLGPVSVSGFLGRSERDVRMVSRMVAESKPWLASPFIYPHPWLSTPSPPRLRIGVWSRQNYIHLHPPVARGLSLAVSRLRSAGYEVVDAPMPTLDSVWELQKTWVEIQDLRKIRSLLTQEPHTPIVQATGIITPPEPPKPLTLDHLHACNARIANLVVQWVNAWNEAGIDVLLYVNGPHAAVPFDKYTYLGFTGVFNVIDWPAMVLPLGMGVDRDVDTKKEDWRRDVAPWNEVDKEIMELYDEVSGHGLPLNVQLIGRRFEDEMLLAVAEKIGPVLRGEKVGVKGAADGGIREPKSTL